MKICASCHEDLPKDKFSKKQWKLEKRRCKVCTADNREVQPLPPSSPINNNNGSAISIKHNDGGIDRLLGSMTIKDNEMISPSDEELFKQPPTEEDCPICFLRLPSLCSGRKYQVCCGKEICTGCMRAVALRCHEQLCPFCRFPAPFMDEGLLEMLMKRVELDDPEAIFSLGNWYKGGMYGLPQDHANSLRLWHRAGELGCADAFHNIGNAYLLGRDGERDTEKAMRYWELAAMGGGALARHNLGLFEQKSKGNFKKALKHFMISAMGGQFDSLDAIKQLYMDGHATKDDYLNALKARQAYLDEIRSDQRDKAAAVDEQYKYY